MKTIKYLILCLILVPMILTGCQWNGNLKENQELLNIYFFNTADNTLVVEKVKVALEENAPSETKMSAVIDALNKGPHSSSLQGNVPTDLKIKDISLKDQVAFINFNSQYFTLPIGDQIMIRASLVWSLTDLEFITGVEFFVENEPLTNQSNDKIGPINRNNILFSALDPNPPTNIQTITLYFTDINYSGLYKEQRDIQVNNNVPIERYIIEELIKGPVTEGLISALPPGTKLNEVKTQENVCQVDLSYDKALAAPKNEKLLVYAVVNSLTETSPIKKVSFLKDGKKQTDTVTGIDFNTLFERDEELIISNE